MFESDKVKLPGYTPDGNATRRHPLLHALDVAADLEMTSSDVARAMNVTPQTLWIWKNRAKKSRHFLLPAEQIPKLSQVTGIPPFFFRPDLWPDIKWRFA